MRLLPSRLIAALCALVAGLALAACGASSTAHTVTTPPGGHRPGLVSVIEDDAQVGTNPAGTLAIFESLGAQVVRYNVAWASTVPGVYRSRTKPRVDTANPGAKIYDWAELDAIDHDVSGAGMRLYLTLTEQAPLWATGHDVPASLKRKGCSICDHWKPSPADYRQWVEAVGRRYDGHYTPPGQTAPLPRVSFWSLWNEPNFGPRLAPQSVKNAQGQIVDTAAPQYRRLVEAGWEGLAASGHTPRTDTILIGETAPRGVIDPALTGTTSPSQFIRDLYCVNPADQPLTAWVASALGCPTNGSSAAFLADNPALFQASGWADHPYPDGVAPNVPSGAGTAGASGWADFARLGALEASLDKATAAWGSHTRFDIYDTEFGYFTDPPLKKFDSIPPARAARYLNWAEYLSWKDPRIASYDQYLLIDPPPDGSAGYFMTGLEFYSHKPVPSVYGAYRLPLWLPNPTGSAGRPMTLWGCARPALDEPGRSHLVDIQFSRAGGGAFATLKTVRVDPGIGGCYFTTSLRFPSSGRVRLAYRAGTSTVVSRIQAIRVG